MRRPRAWLARRIPLRSKHATSSTTSVVSARISEPSAPITPATPSGPSASAITSMSAVSARSAVERADQLPRTREAGLEQAAADVAPVVGVGRAAEVEHHVVRDVDDVRDRTGAGRAEALAQPERRGADADAREGAGREAQAAGGVGDAHLDDVASVAGGRRRALGQRQEVGVEDRRDLAGDAADREAVAAVRLDGEVEHDLVERHEVAQVGADLRPLRQHDDAVVLRRELELALREHHPVRDEPAQLRLAQRRVRARQERSGERHDDGVAGREVRGAADDLARLGLADVDTAEAQAVGVRVLLEVRDATDPEPRVVVADVGRAAALDGIDLEAGEHEAAGELVGRDVDRDVLAEPGQRHPHDANCSLKRRSLS